MPSFFSSEMGSQTFFAWAGLELSISASQVARIIGVSHRYPALLQFLKEYVYIFIIFAFTYMCIHSLGHLPPPPTKEYFKILQVEENIHCVKTKKLSYQIK
jgi:hypothetical protein